MTAAGQLTISGNEGAPGAAWWEFKREKVTVTYIKALLDGPSDRCLAEDEAERRYPGGKLPKKETADA